MPIAKLFSNNRFISKLGVIVVALTLLGCAVGEPYGTAKSKIPALKSGMSRIFVYRGLNPLAMFQPRVFTLNGKHIADTMASTILYHDVKPGHHDVNFNNGRDKLSINVLAGGAVYLKYLIVSDDVAIGNTAIEIIDPKVAEAELTGIHLIDTKIRHPDELK